MLIGVGYRRRLIRQAFDLSSDAGVNLGGLVTIYAFTDGIHHSRILASGRIGVASLV